jgi:hypothetical protein
MKRIRVDTINISGGVSNKGEPRPVSMPVEVWGDDHATNSIFNGEGVPQGPERSRSVDAEPPADPGFEDATFSPKGWNPTPKPPKAGGTG